MVKSRNQKNILVALIVPYLCACDYTHFDSTPEMDSMSWAGSLELWGMADSLTEVPSNSVQDEVRTVLENTLPVVELRANLYCHLGISGVIKI